MHPLKKLCEDNLIVTFTPIADRAGDWHPNAKHFIALVTFKDREIATQYTIGPAIDAPEASGLIHSLLLDAACGRESFEDFCASCGYDTDSRKAYATWEACIANNAKVEFLFGADLSAWEEASQDF